MSLNMRLVPVNGCYLKFNNPKLKFKLVRFFTIAVLSIFIAVVMMRGEINIIDIIKKPSDCV